MAENSKISWTDHTANYWWGCMKVSPGCQNCYAETLSKRYGKQIWGPPQTTDREYKKGVWQEVIKWNKQSAIDGVRKRVFVQSMADFFEDHKQVVQWRRDALALMLTCRYLDFQILTKRPENILPMLKDAGDSLLRHGGHNAAGVQLLRWLKHGVDYAPANLWIGTSVENQEQADKRIPELLKVPASVKFLSCEPLLGPVNLATGGYLSPGWTGAALSGVSWCIAGAESGYGARPMNLDWVRQLRDDCVAADVPFFFKQIVVNGKKVELPELDGQVWAQFPQQQVPA